MAEEILSKIQEVEKESESIIFSANEKSKEVLKNIELKIKTDGERILSETKNNLGQLKSKLVLEAEISMSELLSKEKIEVENILNIDDMKIDSITNILKERIVK